MGALKKKAVHLGTLQDGAQLPPHRAISRLDLAHISPRSRLYLAHISPGEQLTPQRAPFDLREAITARLPSIVRCMPRNLTSNPNINPNP